MTAGDPIDDPWTARFHAGDRAVLEQCYRDHFASVLAAANRILPTVDAETVVHDVFVRLLSEEKVRQSFRGGNVRSWLVQVAANAAVDTARRKRREMPTDIEEPASADVSAVRFAEEVEAKLLVERFRQERLPDKLRDVFEVRFVRQLSQREAAKVLAIPRTSLVYQEQRVRELLEEFLLGKEGP